MKKRSLTLLSLLLVLLTVSTALAVEDTLTFRPTFTNAMDMSAREWFENKEMRAALTIMLALDYAQENPDFDSTCFVTNSSYVAYDRDEGHLAVTFLTDSNDAHLLLYSPINETVAYSVMPDTTPFVVEAALEESFSDYYTNKYSTLSEVVGYIQEALE